MKRTATFWLLWAMCMIVFTGMIGDAIFAPHPAAFSFRIFSGYTVAAMMTVAAIICLNLK